eukprot:SAG22_NODE_1644_length_3902_cov_2.850118_4_plen_86_part_00
MALYCKVRLLLHVFLLLPKTPSHPWLVLSVLADGSSIAVFPPHGLADVRFHPTSAMARMAILAPSSSGPSRIDVITLKYTDVYNE